MIDRRDLVVGLSLFALAFAVRLIFAVRLAFPPLDDPAFYLQTARNLATGRGLITDVIWNYFVPFNSVTHPSHEYWMPLATWLMAPFLKLGGDTLWIAQLPGLLCGALLAPLTFWLGRLRWPTPRDRAWAAAAAGLLIAGALPVYQSASTDSAAPFALCATLALIAGGLAIERRSMRWSIGAGLFGGLAYLARSDGLLIPIVIGVGLGAAIMRHQLGWSHMLGLGVATAIVVGVWWLRNLATFGATQPVSPWSLVALQDYGQLFNAQSVPSLDSLLARGWPFIFDLRWQALWHNVEVWLVVAFPFGLLGLPGLILDRRPVLRVGLIYGLMLLATTALLFSVPSLMGLVYHSAAATLPWLAVGSVLIVRRVATRWRSAAPAVYAAQIGLILFQSVIAWPAVIADSRSNQVKFETAAAWLRSNVPSDQPVITNEAHSLNYASGYAALTLPNQEAPASVVQLADRYGARFVVVFGTIGLYPAVLDGADEVIKRFADDGISIYELRS